MKKTNSLVTRSEQESNSVGRNAEKFSPVEIRTEDFPKVSRDSLWELGAPLLGIYMKNSMSTNHSDIWTSIFISAVIPAI